MSIVEINAGPITTRYLERKTKSELARMYMDLLNIVEQKDARYAVLEERLARHLAAQDYDLKAFQDVWLSDKPGNTFLSEYPSQEKYVAEWWEERYLPVVRSGA